MPSRADGGTGVLQVGRVARLLDQFRGLGPRARRAAPPLRRFSVSLLLAADRSAWRAMLASGSHCGTRV